MMMVGDPPVTEQELQEDAGRRSEHDEDLDEGGDEGESAVQWVPPR